MRLARRGKSRPAPVEKHFQERNADLSTTLRSGRDDKREGGALPAMVVAEQEPFFISLGGPKVET
jgi:hypothetical protein